MDERAAITLLKQGDIRGLEHLVRAYQVRAVRAAYLITHDRPLSEDIVQSAFIRAYERIGQFDDTRPFGPWFFRSVANDAARAAAQRRRIISLDDERPGAESPHMSNEPIDPDPGPEALLLSAESRQEVWDALDRLPAQQRAALVMRYHLDLPEAEVAGRLGIPAGTAKSRLHHARKRMHAALRQRRCRPSGTIANHAEGRARPMSDSPRTAARARPRRRGPPDIPDILDLWPAIAAAARRLRPRTSSDGSADATERRAWSGPAVDPAARRRPPNRQRRHLMHRSKPS